MVQKSVAPHNEYKWNALVRNYFTQNFLHRLDLFSRAILGWDISDSLAANSVVKAIEKAQRTGWIAQGALFHSDRGCQYTSNSVRKALGESMQQSMSAKGYCYDNAFAESCFATIKAELLPDSQLFEDKKAARRAVFDYIETFYNPMRRHSVIGQISPLQGVLKNCISRGCTP